MSRRRHDAIGRDTQIRRSEDRGRAVLAGAAGLAGRRLVVDSVLAGSVTPDLRGRPATRSSSETPATPPASSNTTLTNRPSSGTALLVDSERTGAALRATAHRSELDRRVLHRALRAPGSAVSRRGIRATEPTAGTTPRPSGAARPLRGSGQQTRAHYLGERLQADGVQAVHTGTRTAIRATASAGWRCRLVGPIRRQRRGDRRISHRLAGTRPAAVVDRSSSGQRSAHRGSASRASRNGSTVTTDERPRGSLKLGRVAVRAMATAMTGSPTGVHAEVASAGVTVCPRRVDRADSPYRGRRRNDREHRRHRGLCICSPRRAARTFGVFRETPASASAIAARCQVIRMPAPALQSASSGSASARTRTPQGARLGVRGADPPSA